MLRAARIAAAALLAGAAAMAQPASALTLDLLPRAVGLSEETGPAQATGFGLAGFDPVSYQLDPTPRAGSPEHEFVHRGVVWRFASRANKAAFQRDPETFMPRVGGFDAAAAAEGRLVWANPTIYTVVDGRLFLFRSEAEKKRFLADTHLAEAAETRWPELHRLVVKG